MIDVQQATVYKGKLPAAELSRGPEGVTFRYLDGYLGPAVAHTLPVGGEPVRTPPGALPPFFAGLLPEGRRLDALRRWVKTSADDEFSLLLAVGGDTVGDVRVVAADTPPSPVAAMIDADHPFDAARIRDELAQPDRRALAGVQPKASGAMVG